MLEEICKKFFEKENLRKEENINNYENALKLNNKLLNLWIRCYFNRFCEITELYDKSKNEWTSEFCDKTKKELALQLKDFTDSRNDKWIMKRNKKLTNYECIGIWVILKEYYHINDLSFRTILEECLDEPVETYYYIKSLEEEQKFPGYFSDIEDEIYFHFHRNDEVK
jgi:hypothetical protein